MHEKETASLLQARNDDQVSFIIHCPKLKLVKGEMKTRKGEGGKK